MTYRYQTHGICSRAIFVSLSEDGVIEDVRFQGGCNGNTQGVAALCIGAKAVDVIPRLENIDCGGRGTSCPAQLAEALKLALAKQE